MTEEELVVAGQKMEEDTAAADRGAWAGSWVCQDDLDWLYRTRRIPAGVVARLPSVELAPSPNPGKFVVFLSHFQRGFGLPVSDFFRDWLSTYHLQPHHLPANAITSLCFRFYDRGLHRTVAHEGAVDPVFRPSS